MNRWNIPEWLEEEVANRDRRCVYCGVEFLDVTGARHQRPTWEHIINDAQMITGENIVRCCVSCNASKGTRELAVWLESDYCKQRGITAETVAPVVRAALAHPVNPGEAGA